MTPRKLESPGLHSPSAVAPSTQAAPNSLTTLNRPHTQARPHTAHTTSPSTLFPLPSAMPLGGDPPPDPGGAPPPPPHAEDSSGGPPPLPRFAKRRRSTPTASFVAALSSVPGGERDALAGVAAALASREAAVAAAEAAVAARSAALARAEASLMERNAALSTAEAALAARASAGAVAAAALTAARAADPPTSGDGSGCLDSLADAAAGASDGGGGGSRNGATDSKPTPPPPATTLPSPPALQLLATAPPPVSLPHPPPPVAVPRPSMAPAHHPATPTAPGAELSKKMDAKSCDHILCLTKEMARELLPPVPAAWGGGPVQLSVEVVDDAGAVWPMTYRCVPSRYSYELRAGWKQFAAAARVGVGDVVHLSRVDAPPQRAGAAHAGAAGGDAPRIRLRLERAPRPPPPPPGRRMGGGGGGVRAPPPPPPPARVLSARRRRACRRSRVGRCPARRHTAARARGGGVRGSREVGGDGAAAGGWWGDGCCRARCPVTKKTTTPRCFQHKNVYQQPTLCPFLSCYTLCRARRPCVCFFCFVFPSNVIPLIHNPNDALSPCFVPCLYCTTTNAPR